MRRTPVTRHRAVMPSHTYSFPGRWLAGTSLILGPALLLTGVLLRAGFDFFFPRPLAPGPPPAPRPSPPAPRCPAPRRLRLLLSASTRGLRPPPALDAHLLQCLPRRQRPHVPGRRPAPPPHRRHPPGLGRA